VDATYLARHDRDRLARVVRGYGWRHVFIACEAAEAVVRERLDARDASVASDARFDTYLAQRSDRDLYGGEEAVLRLDTGRPLEAVRHDLLPRLWAWRQGRPAA
jgi:predicted kinase